MVKRKNWLKDFLSKKIQVPVTYGTAAGAMSGSSANIPKVESTVGRTLLEAAPAAAIVAAPVIASSAPAITHGLQVMVNPALAKTTAGAIGATALDASGLVASVEGLKDTERKIKNHEYTAKDVPMTILSGMGLLPGASVLTRQENIMPIVKGVSNMLKDDIATTKLILSGKYQPTFGIVAQPMKTTATPKDKVMPAPKVWGREDDFLNSPLFQNSSQSAQNQFFKYTKEYVNPTSSNVRIRIQDQPNVKEIEKELSSIVKNRTDEYLPFSIVRLDDGTFTRLPGNIEEIARSYYGQDNGFINLNEGLWTRAHDIDLQSGFKTNGSLFYAGQGDEGLVLPYAYSKKRVLGDLKVKDPEKYRKFYSLYTNRKTALDKEIEMAFKAGDFKSAAKLYTEYMAIPELEKPYLIDRLRRVVPMTEFTSATESVPNNRRIEALRMLTAGIDKENNVIVPAFDQYGKIDFSNSRMSIFSGNPEQMERIVGGYYLTPNASYKNPDITLKSWKYGSNTTLAHDVVNNELRKYNLDAIKENITTNVLGQMFNNKGSIVAFPAADFHHPYIKETWTPPKLMMVAPENGKYLYRTDQYRLGLKHGGIIKAQNGWVLDKWQKAYNSKFGKGLRDFLYGQDRDLSDEEYFKKHGYNKPVGGIGVLGALVAPEWEGLDAPVVAENFGRAGYIKGTPWTARLKYTKPTNPSGFPKTQQVSNLDKFLQKSVQEQNDIVRYWNGEKFSNLQQLQRNPQQYKLFQHWLNKQ